LALDPDNRLGRFNLASLELTQGKLPEAARDFDEVVRRDPRNTGARILLAVVRQRQGQYAEAEALLTNVVDESPDNAIALNNLAYLYSLQGVKLDRASELARRAVELNGGNWYFLDTRGWLLHLQRKDGEALQYLQRAVELAPDDPVIKGHRDAVTSDLSQKARGTPSASAVPHGATG
jgi:tetratricopeptide (TPR) repeat protein